MSWGERSCTLFGECPHEPKINTCNVACNHYISNGKTPDSEIIQEDSGPSISSSSMEEECALAPPPKGFNGPSAKRRKELRKKRKKRK